MKKTRARKAIIEILQQAKEPLSAASVYSALTITADQATVYRNLHVLEDEGLAHSFILHCADHGTERYYTASPEIAEGDLAHRHWFHCERCHCFTDLGSCKLSELVAGYEAQHNITVLTHTLYLTGLCSSCR